jgi:hydrogenase maturation factor
MGWVVGDMPQPCFVPSTHWIGDWVGLRVGLATEAIEESFASARDQTSVIQSVVRQYADWATLACVKENGI